MREAAVRTSPEVPTFTEKMVARFWDKIVKSDGCWEWIGARTPFGHGRLTVPLPDGRKRVVSAHRIAWELVNGPPPPGVLVLHRCDYPPCVRIDHLFLGSDADNSADMAVKGRARNHITGPLPGPRPAPHTLIANPNRGERNGFARLTETDVVEIRCRAALGETRAEIAAAFGIAPGSVGGIVSRRRWAHVP